MLATNATFVFAFFVPMGLLLGSALISLAIWRLLRAVTGEGVQSPVQHGTDTTATSQPGGS